MELGSDRGMPLSPTEENDFFASSMSHSRSEPNSIALSANVTDSPGRRTRGASQKVNRVQAESSSKTSDWGAADGWDDWDAGEKPKSKTTTTTKMKGIRGIKRRRRWRHYRRRKSRAPPSP